MNKQINIEQPTKKHAKEIFKLVNRCKPLDINSEYLYLLQTTYFKDTCSVALMENKAIGFISGYLVPNKKDTLFIWQVAVDEIARGEGLAKKLLLEILQRDNLQEVEYIHTTISPSNIPSQKFFEKFASDLNTTIKKSILFDKDDFNNGHEQEVLYEIGPFKKGKK
ncbi:diaminobutyrate acetyltransferase [Malaciobacter mytili]|uniref:L-2,4-diaminobutyric acid acetyltransferase n=1 Tax=Malaciobacter mytili LMG 24559 TaxID=1032238 RepID=A0AAX2AFA7_9BACT|nr:diaminobutyrate acetyltransferase [Malaciobacter mytili]AXH15230.1 diaminobutanoate acetyltransferase [Malaciobacter mytili LMG 24559]RXK15578.1 diaminobutyrate acetyltransferase [Malaciobacter mytili LMG 24559]